MMEKRSFGNLTYLISFPENFDESKSYPTLFHTHGAGGRGNDPSVLLQAGPLKEIQNGREALKNCIVVAPQCFADTWFEIFEQLIAFCEYIYSLPYVDPTHFYASGISMGGYAILQLMMSRPALWTAGAVCCGGGMYWNAARMKEIPLWFFHGEDDPTVAVDESRRFVKNLQAKDANVKLTVYENTAHNCWDKTYARDDLYEWLFAQRK